MRYLIFMLAAAAAWAQPIAPTLPRVCTGSITTACTPTVNGSGTYVPTIPAGGGVWGAITGTITNQSDLQTALGTKGPAIQIGTWANLPSCNAGLLGVMYLFIDSYYNSGFCSNSGWIFSLNGMTMAPPDVAATFSSVNVTGSFDSTHGAGVINQPTAQPSVAGRFTAAPVTATWHVILAFRYTITVNTNNIAGICVRNSGSGKLDMLGQFAANNGAVIFAFTNPTTPASTPFNNSTTQNFGMGQPLWLRFGQGGGNQTWDYSNDQGVTWINLLTESATVRFTTDQVGFCTNGARSMIAALHWAVTN